MSPLKVEVIDKNGKTKEIKFHSYMATEAEEIGIVTDGNIHSPRELKVINFSLESEPTDGYVEGVVYRPSTLEFELAAYIAPDDDIKISGLDFIHIRRSPEDHRFNNPPYTLRLRGRNT